ncbi:DUF3370 family protein [Cyanobium sp. Morenito 9A2]|uniref:DUF3370 family protein n=1 Tax=Cyanobium sp. Morenito 9A2 TaxID=2823718 RepID=UPI0020CF3368|nr:DUF3370 family protein [Cyanobium sp. Morenito 9A2]
MAWAYVPLMAGQAARPLSGRFNNVPVLHSNQPEEVFGPGILVNTAPGSAVTSESGQPLTNAAFTFNGDFGLHVHHKYAAPPGAEPTPGRVRSELALATILINPGYQPVRIRFDRGAFSNSFEAPYRPNYLMGVKPLGPRPWNTGPGDATAVTMLRGKLDARLPSEVVVPPRSRMVLFRTQLPAQGIANGLLRGRSDGPFQMAVVAAKNPENDYDIVAVLDQGVLAPGRIYLNRLADIDSGRVFSRVAGVAYGDAYQASLSYDLRQGALHVPLTSTNRHNFGTREVQVNPLASRMVDSSLDNVGTYGVRFDVQLNLIGSGPYALALSHPTPNGRTFTAFRGSIGIETDEGYREVHVGMRSGESLQLASLNLRPGVTNTVKVSLVYPADSTPGHLLSVVPEEQLAQLLERERQVTLARAAAARSAAAAPIPPSVATNGIPAAQVKAPMSPRASSASKRPRPFPPSAWRKPLPPPPPPLINNALIGTPSSGVNGMPPAFIPPARLSQTLMDRYQQAVEAQQRIIKNLMGR